jgi:phosphatidylserine decarboxylase
MSAIFAKGFGFPVSALSYAAAQLLRVLPRVQLSRAVGRLCDAPLPRPVSRAIAAAYSKAYGVDMTEVAERHGPYISFDEFFTRALRVGARSISTDPVVSPADGDLRTYGPVDSGSSIHVKGNRYDVAELIGDAADARRYVGGQFAVVYLSPRDYHRVHSPVDGNITLVRGIPGDLFPVNAIGEKYVPQLFVRNNRVSIVIDTPTVGRVTVVMVGAVIVGRISVAVIDAPAVPPGVHVITPAAEVKRGDEIGMFHLGSTAVLLFEPGVDIQRATGAVRYGQSLLKPA